MTVIPKTRKQRNSSRKIIVIKKLKEIVLENEKLKEKSIIVIAKKKAKFPKWKKVIKINFRALKDHKVFITKRPQTMTLENQKGRFRKKPLNKKTLVFCMKRS